MASKQTETKEAQRELAAPLGEPDTSALAQRAESAIAERPSVSDDELLADAGAGHEEERTDDIQVPTLVILQALSPQLKPAHAAFLPEARPGMICDTLTGQLFDGAKGVEVVSCYFRPVINLMQMVGNTGEWRETWPVNDPRAQRPTQRDDKNRDVLREAPDHYLQLVAEHYVIALATREAYAIRMRRTQIRPSKRWNSLLSKYHPLVRDGAQASRPRFGMVSRLRVVSESKNGNDWFNWSPEIVGLLTEGELADPILYRQARAFYALVREGRVEAKVDAEEYTDGGEES